MSATLKIWNDLDRDEWAEEMGIAPESVDDDENTEPTELDDFDDLGIVSGTKAWLDTLVAAQ